jgi:hypothetical protein
MSAILVSLYLFLCFAAGCQPASTPTDPDLLVYSDDAITFEYPDWTESKPDDKAVFLFRSNGKDVFFASRYPV